MGAFKTQFFRSLLVRASASLLCVACAAAAAQMPDYGNVGRAPSEAEVRAWDISIGLDGKELPSGKGTATDGALVYEAKCAACHGQNLEGTPLAPVLVGGKGSLTAERPLRTIGSYWPFATSIWDYVNRAMPRNQEETLTADEVYAVTAFLLFRNDIIRENDVIDARSLPKVQMPNRNGFIPQAVNEIHDIKKRGCRLGTCP